MRCFIRPIRCYRWFRFRDCGMAIGDRREACWMSDMLYGIFRASLLPYFISLELQSCISQPSCPSYNRVHLLFAASRRLFAPKPHLRAHAYKHSTVHSCPSMSPCWIIEIRSYTPRATGPRPPVYAGVVKSGEPSSRPILNKGVSTCILRQRRRRTG